ncbi:hypothetical protein VNI00_006535 [Paramarasmius palmivorus]|uniref:Uncharacterized protein n=1 Tax=Paramarasmius palmivorus TaxID=297713 RepID=A0AAW0D7C3_9AGAR
MSINPFSSWNSSAGSAPSVYGALPTAGSPTGAAGVLRFVFTSLNPDVLHCTVIGPNMQPHFYIVTDPASGFTILKRHDGKAFGVIEWQSHPIVEIKDLVRKQLSAHFLRLSSDQRSRRMAFNEGDYAWVPQQAPAEGICLYPANSRDFVARITRDNRAVVLELTQNAVQAGLLLPCVLATVLVQSGRQID